MEIFIILVLLGFLALFAFGVFTAVMVGDEFVQAKKSKKRKKKEGLLASLRTLKSTADSPQTQSLLQSGLLGSFASAQETYMYDDDPEERLRFTEGTIRGRSACLLFTGSLLGFLAFVFAAGLGMGSESKRSLNLDGEPFASGVRYNPETVSELVHDPNSASGKAFFAFATTASICLLFSWYPWHLRNVYVGDDVWGCRGFKGLFLNLRSLLPPLGMLTVACIHVVPKFERTSADKIACNLHTAGAVSAIGGFCGLEFLTILAYSHSHRETGAEMKPLEKRLRLFFNCCTAVSIVVFQLGGVLCGLNFAGGDTFRTPTPDDISKALQNDAIDIAAKDSELRQHHVSGLVNTATGLPLTFKYVEFWGEVMAGLFMIASHFTIWYFCDERRANLGDRLPKAEYFILDEVTPMEDMFQAEEDDN